MNPGTLVKRSDHYIKENCWTDSEREKAKNKIGIISSIKLLEDDICIAIAFPLVHWEGESYPNMCHPLNVKLANGETLPTVTMNANQQVKKK